MFRKVVSWISAFKILVILFWVFAFLYFIPLTLNPIRAANNSFVSIVNPVRGNDFWDLANQKPVDAVEGQLALLRAENMSATFLLRFDALQDQAILNSLKNSPDEKGLFLEITPSLTTASHVTYHQSSSWHNAASVLLTGYSVEDRKKLIDSAFANYKEKFGEFPKSVGAWWIDAGSLSYMQQKYGVISAMIVADQYSTDSYQIWGQYWGTPYYPAKNNALFPAQSIENKIPIVITQWAARDPVNGYGTGVEESTFSVQVNDYTDYHGLDVDYFSKLIDIYTPSGCPDNSFCQITVGLENSYSWQKYKSEYQKQITVLKTKQQNGQFNIVTSHEFASWYLKTFPEISPDHIISTPDPLGSSKQAVWYMNPFYRVGWIYDSEGSVIRDLRQYVTGQNEICLDKPCNEVNFATFATRVLDEVTYGQKKVIDGSLITNLRIKKNPDKVIIAYNNASGRQRDLEFLQRDISIDGKTSSVDSFILETIQDLQNKQKQILFNPDLSLKTSLFNQIGQLFIFIVFIILAVFIPGLVLTKKIIPQISKTGLLFLAVTLGLVSLTLIGFLSQFLLKNYWLVPIWILINLGVILYYKWYRLRFEIKLTKEEVVLLFFIIGGAIFLTIPTFRSGSEYGYGIGFWGPNGHDGVWHLSLINQLEKGAPPANPILSETQLLNYHYFFDLLVAETTVWTKVPAIDLLFREFPILFGLLLGLGVISLLDFLQEKKNLLVASLSLYLVYTAGSFGWIVEILKGGGWNGESDFWANQAISFNLNPPFMISLLLMVAFIELLITYARDSRKLLVIPLVLLSGSLFEFKAYAAILMGLSLLVLTIFKLLKKQKSLLPVLVGMGLLTVILLIPNYPSLSAIFQTGSGVFEFSPLWFVHSMIDSPDRLGLIRLSLTRVSGYENHNILKILYVEGLGMLLFILGNLGIRLVGIVAFFRQKLWKQFSYQVIFVVSLFSITIPLLFIQKGTPWNTIQFFYYSLFFSSILAALIYAEIINKIPKIGKYILMAVVIILTPINCIAVAQGYLYPKPHAFISSKEVDGLTFLKNQSHGTVLTFPYNKYLKDSVIPPLPLLAYETTAYVSAFSNQQTFEEDEIQQDILNFSSQPEYIKRLVAEKDFFSGMASSQAVAFLHSNHIKYIYLPKIYGINLSEPNLGIKKIFENEQVIIYKVV